MNNPIEAPKTPLNADEQDTFFDNKARKLKPRPVPDNAAESFPEANIFPLTPKQSLEMADTGELKPNQIPEAVADEPRSAPSPKLQSVTNPTISEQKIQNPPKKRGESPWRALGSFILGKKITGISQATPDKQPRSVPQQEKQAAEIENQHLLEKEIQTFQTLAKKQGAKNQTLWNNFFRQKLYRDQDTNQVSERIIHLGKTLTELQQVESQIDTQTALAQISDQQLEKNPELNRLGLEQMDLRSKLQESFSPAEERFYQEWKLGTEIVSLAVQLAGAETPRGGKPIDGKFQKLLATWEELTRLKKEINNLPSPDEAKISQQYGSLLQKIEKLEERKTRLEADTQILQIECQLLRDRLSKTQRNYQTLLTQKRSGRTPQLSKVLSDEQVDELLDQQFPEDRANAA